MLHPSTKRLIDKLSEMTRKQRVAWSEGENGTITHDTEGYRVILTPEPHGVLLTDALGKQIESCTPDEFMDETDAAGRPYTFFVADLYREAHRHARGAERAIHTVLKGLETVDAGPDTQPEIAVDPAEMIEDPGDDTDVLPEAYPELEGQNDMARAVASMADEVNGDTAPLQADEPPVAALADLEPPAEAGTRPGSAPEPVMPPLLDAEGDEAAGIDTAQPDEPAPDAGEDCLAMPADGEAEDILSGTASLLPAGPGPDMDEAPATEIQPAAHALWPEDENAPDQQAEPDRAGPESEPQPAPPEPRAPETFGSVFGSGVGNLSEYMTNQADEAAEPTAPVEPAAAPEPSMATARPAPYTPAFTEAAAPAQPGEPAPETGQDAPAEPAPFASISLSGMSSGFGLGSAVRTPSPGPARATGATPDAVSPDRPRIIIDGTADLPDDLALSAFDTELDQAPFGAGTPDPVAEAPAEQQAPARPEEKAFNVPAQSAQPEQADEPERESPGPKATTRFNPWN